MRPSPAQLERVAETLLARFTKATLVELDAPEATIRAEFAALLGRNFAEEAEIEAQAQAEADRVVRQGAAGVRREDVDPRRVALLIKQRIAKAKGFSL